MKKIFIIIVFIFVILLNNRYKVFAQEDAKLCLVYDEEKYDKSDLIEISFDLPKFFELFEVIVRIEYDDNVLEIVENNSGYFFLDNHSIFDDFVINKKFNDNIVYAEMIKDDLDDGYYSSYKNNLCKVKFTAKTHIDDIKKYFNENNISIYLFDINHNIINYELNVIKKIKAEFSKDSYIVAVEDEMFQLNEMFKVYNRGENEYLILEENKIDTSVVGSKILQIGVLDLITGNYTTYSTIVNIVDNIAPIIIAESKYTILDANLSIDSFYENINIIDNYDKAPKVEVVYYDSDNNEIFQSDVIECFKKTRYIKCSYEGIDSSNNRSEKLDVDYILKDTTVPIVTATNIVINDVDFLEFDLNNFVKVSDNLDLTPSYYYSFYDSEKNAVDSLEGRLTVDNECYIGITGIDDSNNKSEELIIKITMKDTTNPILIYNKEEEIVDTKLDLIDFKSLINVSDNSKKECTVKLSYYLTEEVSYEKFIDGLKKMESGKVKYFVYDSSLNKSECEVLVRLKDTTPPVINVSINDNDVFRTLDKIEYDVFDNISKNIVVNAYLDGVIYDDNLLVDGEHILFIEAIDEEGNISLINYKFVISSDSCIEEVFNHNLRLKSGVIITFVLISCILILFVKIWMNFKYRKIVKEK